MEERVQNEEQVLAKMMKVLTRQESKLLDQEGRSRRENIRIYNVPEGEEGTSMVDFVEKLLRDTLDLPPATELHIERAHRSLVPKPPGGPGDKPRSIIIRFNRYKVKEEISRRAWGKKRVFLNGRMIYFDQDYPPAVLQKRKEYSEAKRLLKQNKIRFQTPRQAASIL
ncbi:LINE-1 retrotransposable element ORF1 protein [Dissostichus eleginoides]|uniref:LINE-1 retrotransposable element ORF1 protein n=1 Tax=Dissostichus eleginoides TaxID=100907 RepID=A0AAD9ER27_DISEL|nr:LINE-1 retrotransposable element ORF1 protein [Dissostichus eleginoides]